MADIQRYLNLVTSQHADKPKFKAWLAEALSAPDDVVSLLNEFNNYFNLTEATGAQLDILGDIVGRKRVLDFQPIDGSSPVLDDDYYRLLIQAKIAQNQWDGTLPQIYEIWNTLFPLVYLVINDNQDMSMDALIIGLASQLEKDLVSRGYVIPKPQGVQINYMYIEQPVFAYGLDNDVFKGYEEGYWSEYY